jgi:hypothetical protein
MAEQLTVCYLYKYYDFNFLKYQDLIKQIKIDNFPISQYGSN